ncbi:MAG: hypothetical protein SWO11_06895 [Thermodesulfobacteriota bacterium]|nr:hypothetical protein [Thermodesulfobacteriota bacterium]
MWFFKESFKGKKMLVIVYIPNIKAKRYKKGTKGKRGYLRLLD